jgi:hypothetical protein
MDVVAEELWITLVATTPINKPVIGFEVAESRKSAKPHPRSLNPEPIRLMLRKKR